MDNQRTRLIDFPGGMLETRDYSNDSDEGPGVHLERHFWPPTVTDIPRKNSQKSMKDQAQEQQPTSRTCVRVEVREDTQQRSWRLHAREYGALTWVFDKADIPDAARRIIQRCGTHPKDSGVDLVFHDPFPVYEC